MTQQAPTWKDHLGQIPSSQVNAPYAPGTKTLGTKQMESAERQAAADRALRRWEAQMRLNLNMMELEAKKRADAEALAYNYARLDWEKEQFNRQWDAAGANSNPLGLSANGGNLWANYYNDPNHQSKPKPQVSSAPSFWEMMF